MSGCMPLTYFPQNRASSATRQHSLDRTVLEAREQTNLSHRGGQAGANSSASLSTPVGQDMWLGEDPAHPLSGCLMIPPPRSVFLPHPFRPERARRLPQANKQAQLALVALKIEKGETGALGGGGGGGGGLTC